MFRISVWNIFLVRMGNILQIKGNLVLIELVLKIEGKDVYKGEQSEF